MPFLHPALGARRALSTINYNKPRDTCSSPRRPPKTPSCPGGQRHQFLKRASLASSLFQGERRWRQGYRPFAIDLLCVDLHIYHGRHIGCFRQKKFVAVRYLYDGEMDQQIAGASSMKTCKHAAVFSIVLPPLTDSWSVWDILAMRRENA